MIVLELTPDSALGNNGLIPFRNKLVDPLLELEASSRPNSLTVFLFRAVTLLRCSLYVFQFLFVGDWRDNSVIQVIYTLAIFTIFAAC